MQLSQETEIVASGRIKALEKFYVGKVSNAALIEDELKSAGSLSEEVKGQWVTEQMIKAAMTLHVDVFVKPLESGGICIPEIPAIERYEEKHSELRKVGMKGIRDTLPLRQKAEERARKLVYEADAFVDSVKAQIESTDRTTPDGRAEYDQLLDELDKAGTEYDSRYTKWSNEQTNVQRDIQTIEEWKQTVKRGAMTQRDADCDALRQVHNALAILKKFVSGLLTKVPSVGPVIRESGEFDGDPYGASDMRRCYANLLAKFRKTEDLDVATTVIIAIKDSQQGNESVRQFTSRVQEFHEEMVKMGIRQISISDLSAIIMISGMKEAPRRAFLQTETTLSLAMGTDGEADDLIDAGDEEKTVASTKVKRSLLGKTLRFVAKQEAEEQLLVKLSSNGSSKKSDSNTTAKEAQKRMREAQLAFATAVKTEDKEACFGFARYGKCKFGDNCQFKHEMSVLSSDVRRGGRGVCFEWQSTGKCRRKDSCRFEHPPKIAVKATVTAAPPPVPIPGKSASRVLFTSDKVAGDSEDDEVDVVLVRTPPLLACATSESVVPSATDVQYLGWDSMCSLHVASELSVIPDAKTLRKPKEAVGMGGVKPITHKGHSAMFGKVMSYIHGGGTPNLLSVGQECQPDKTGLPGVVLFSASGAVRLRVTPESMAAFAELVDQAEVEGLVQGKAVLHNNVYKEAFGPNGAVEPEEVYPVESPKSAFAISHSMFASRVRLDSVDNILDFMVSSGLNKEALLEGIKNQSLRGLPAVVTEDHVKHYFKYIGKSTEQMEAEITKAPLRLPIDHEAERASAPGEIMQIDNIDPSFSRMAGPVEVDTTKEVGAAVSGHKKVVPSVGGYKDAVLAVDEACGYVHLVGRVSKKNPHKVLGQFMGKWKGRWKNLKFVKADQEFITHESLQFVEAQDVRFRQAVPGDHRRTTSMIEGVIRWILETAQGNMNRLRRVVKDKVITERQARSLWFHALRQAVFASNLRPSLWDPGKTRYEEGTGDVANLSYLVMMPFAMRVMGKNLLASADGRGSECLYIGPSSTVRGGILTYNVATARVSVKYAFLPINDVCRPNEAQVRKTSTEVYGKLADVPESVTAPNHNVLLGWEEVAGFGQVSSSPESVPVMDPEVILQPNTESYAEPELSKITSDCPVVVPHVCVLPEAVPASLPAAPGVVVLADTGVSSKSGGGSKAKKPIIRSDYNTRRRAERVNTVVDVEMVEEMWLVEDEMAVSAAKEAEGEAEVPTRPPKPKVPPSRECNVHPRWIAAEEREAVKLMEEDTVHELPVDTMGNPIIPADAMVLRLLKIREFKWKPDPETGVEGWLECVRLVCDGSVDKRPEKYYAETPDRTLLLLMTSMEASLGIKVTGSDVTRAYLNAESIDRNIVIIAPKGLKGLPRMSLLNKGLYGSRGGALSWQVWIDGKLKDLDFVKLQVCRGVYIKKELNGEPVRAYRHSDDFRMSCMNEDLRIDAENRLKKVVRMADFSTLNRFLGCTFERVNAVTGLPDENGTIVLVRQEEKIKEMEEKFSAQHQKHNPKNRIRKVALPVDAIREDHELTENARELLRSADIEVYQSIVGCIQWIVGCTRPDGKLGCFLLSTRLAKQRSQVYGKQN
jgi:uncharacterized protein with GYD domain